MIELTDLKEKHVEIIVDGELFTRYVYAREWEKPFLYPLIGPTGKNMARHFPIETDVPEENTDHPWHRGLWSTAGEINGIDYWNEVEGQNTGFIRNTGIKKVESGKIGILECTHDYIERSGKNPLKDHQRYEFSSGPNGQRIIDYTVKIETTGEEVLLGDTKEQGLIAIRVAHTINADAQGRIEDSQGRVGEEKCWGKTAEWCDTSGPVENAGVVGIALMDHPSNPRHPTNWHVRDYGINGANCFGYSHFYPEEGKNGEMILAAGESLTFKYRALFHKGDATEGNVAECYAEFSKPL